MSELITEIAKEGGNSVFNAIKEYYNYFRRYEENVIDLQSGIDELTSHLNDINEKVKEGKLKGKVLNDVATTWLSTVEGLLRDKDLKKLTMNEGYRKQKDQCCFGTCNINPRYRYKCSKYAKEKTGVIHAQIDKVPNKDAVTRSRSVEEVKSIIDGYKKCGLESRKQVMDNVIRKIKDEGVKLVAIYGEEAVGKTRLVKEITSELERSGSVSKVYSIDKIEIGRADGIKDIENKLIYRNDFPGTFLYDWNCLQAIICLDTVWEKFDLERTRISNRHNVQILMVCREQRVCKEMGVEECNIFELGRLSEDEAKYLFWDKVGLKESMMLSGEYLRVAERLLSKCGGLPLAVITLAGVLSGNGLRYWESFDAKLENGPRPSISSIGGSSNQQQLAASAGAGAGAGLGGHDDDHEYLSILETSYLLLSSEERMMFLLCCLFHKGAQVVTELMTCAIGLGLIQCVDTISEAEALVFKWIDRLVSSTLLECYDNKHTPRSHVKIPDLVQRYGISILAKGGNMVMVDAFPRWMLYETCQKYFAISLMSGADYSRLNGFNSDKLQILILDRSQPQGRFPDGFFEGMTNLKVLVLRGMDFTLGLPNSMRKLKWSLRTLHFEKCMFRNIAGIGELTNLVVLSLRESNMEEIPKEIGNLCNLRLLDLRQCTIEKGGIPANVLSKLSLLEGLYAISGSDNWHYGKCVDGGYEYEYASIGELNHLRYLKVIQLSVEFNDWPIDENQLQFLKNLDHFRISFGYNYSTEYDYYSRVVFLIDNRDLSNTKDISMIRVLLENTQHLHVSGMEKLQHIFDYDDEDDIHGKQQQCQPKLQSYNNNNNLHVLPPPAVEFPYLQKLNVIYCPEMKSLSSTPFKAPNLTQLRVSGCENMKYIFMEYPFIITTTSTTFPALKKMDLWGLPKLESVTGFIKSSTTTTTSITTNDDDPQPPRYILFNNHKPTFPKLEELELWECSKIGQLWEVNCKEMSYYSSFTNLHSLHIKYCDKLETLGSLSIATALVHLKALSIQFCPLLREVISSSKEEEEEEETKAPIFGDEIFPSLEKVELKHCPNLKMFIKGGKLIKDQFLKLSSLHHLEILRCPTMDSFSPLGTSLKTPKLNKVTLDSSEYTMDETKDDINSFLLNHNKPN